MFHFYYTFIIQTVVGTEGQMLWRRPREFYSLHQPLACMLFNPCWVRTHYVHNVYTSLIILVSWVIHILAGVHLTITRACYGQFWAASRCSRKI